MAVSYAVSYKKLWKMLIDKDMKKKDLCAKAGISTASVTKMGKGGHVTTEVLAIPMCRLTVAVIIKSANQQQHLLYRQHALQRDYLILITNCIKTVAWSICRPKKKSCCYTREFFALT